MKRLITLKIIKEQEIKNPYKGVFIENFPKDCVVIENIGVEGIFILVNSKGEVLEWKNNNIIKLFDNMEKYLYSKL